MTPAPTTTAPGAGRDWEARIATTEDLLVQARVDQDHSLRVANTPDQLARRPLSDWQHVFDADAETVDALTRHLAWLKESASRAALRDDDAAVGGKAPRPGIWQRFACTSCGWATFGHYGPRKCAQCGADAVEPCPGYDDEAPAPTGPAPSGRGGIRVEDGSEG